jgi:hypothetical protein
MRTPNPKPSLLLALALPVLALLGCSVQEAALIKVSFVQDRIEVPAGMNKITIRVNRVGTTRRRTPVSAETTFCDVEGDFTLKTAKIGGGFVVARGPEYDIAFAEVFIEEFGETVSVPVLNPQSSTALVAKTPGEALFLAFEEDWEPVFGEVTSVDVQFSSFSNLEPDATPLLDDGSLVDLDPTMPGDQVSGDFAAGDGVWTRRVTGLDAGMQNYAFFINKNEDRGAQRDPYEEGSDDQSVILVK